MQNLHVPTNRPSVSANGYALESLSELWDYFEDDEGDPNIQRASKLLSGAIGFKKFTDLLRLPLAARNEDILVMIAKCLRTRLSKVLFFGSTPHGMWLKLAQHFQLEEFAAGQRVFRQGDNGHKFYFIHSGLVSIYLESAAMMQTSNPDLDSNTCVATLVPGQTVGERALMGEDEKRSATMVATNETTFFTIGREVFVHVMGATDWQDDNFVEKSQFMDTVFPFVELLKNERTSIAYFLEQQVVAMNDIVYDFGSVVEKVYFIKEGSFRLDGKSKSNERMVPISVSNLSCPGECFGEEDVFSQKEHRETRVTCTSASAKVYVIDAKQFQRFFCIKTFRGYDYLCELVNNRTGIREQRIEHTAKVLADGDGHRARGERSSLSDLRECYGQLRNAGAKEKALLNGLRPRPVASVTVSPATSRLNSARTNVYCEEVSAKQMSLSLRGASVSLDSPCHTNKKLPPDLVAFFYKKHKKVTCNCDHHLCVKCNPNGKGGEGSSLVADLFNRIDSLGVSSHNFEADGMQGRPPPSGMKMFNNKTLFRKTASEPCLSARGAITQMVKTLDSGEAGGAAEDKLEYKLEFKKGRGGPKPLGVHKRINGNGHRRIPPAGDYRPIMRFAPAPMKKRIVPVSVSVLPPLSLYGIAQGGTLHYGSGPGGQGYAGPGQGYAGPGQGYAGPGQGYAGPGQGYGPHGGRY